MGCDLGVGLGLALVHVVFIRDVSCNELQISFGGVKLPSLLARLRITT